MKNIQIVGMMTEKVWKIYLLSLKPIQCSVVRFPRASATEKVRFRLIPSISVPSGRFPRARLQSPRHCVPAGSSARAVPAGVAALHSNQLVLLYKRSFLVPTCFPAGVSRLRTKSESRSIVKIVLYTLSRAFKIGGVYLTLKIGIVGTGYFSNVHAELLTKIAGVKITAICGTSLQKTAAMAALESAMKNTTVKLTL